MITLSQNSLLVESPAELPDFTKCRQLFMDFETKNNTHDIIRRKLEGRYSFKGDRICGIAVTGDDCPNAYYVPIRHTQGQNLELGSVLRWLKDHITSVQEWINHNIIFDAIFAQADGCEFTCKLVDTLTLSKVHDSDRMGHGLDELCRDYGLSEKKGSIIQPYLDQMKIKDYGALPIDVCGDYACGDVLSNRDLYKFLLDNRPTDVAGIWGTEIALTAVLYDMERDGLRIDPTECRKDSLLCLRKMIDLSTRISAIAGREWTNSFDCVSDILINQFGLPILMTKKERLDGGEEHDTGEPTFKKDALELYEVHPEVTSNPDLLELVKMIRAYRKESQHKSLFLDSFLEMHDERGYIHPTYNQVVRTGRMSCSRPNAQQQNKRSKALIKPDEGCGIISADYCLTGDTMIVTEHGMMRLDEVVKKKPRVLSCKDGEELWFNKITHSAMIGYVPVYKVTLEDGSIVKCTADHKWMTFQGEMIETKNLTSKLSLAHVKESFAGAYPTWWIKSNRNYFYKHRLCAGTTSLFYHVHHKKGVDKTDWRINGLEVKLDEDHRSDHSIDNWNSMSEREKQQKISQLVSGLKNRRSYNGSENPNYTGAGWIGECPKCGTQFQCYESRHKTYCSRTCRKLHLGKINHKIRSVEPAGMDYVYQITVDNWHTYVLENGLVSGNSQVEYRLIAHYTNDVDVVKAYNENPDVDFHQWVADLLHVKRKAGKTLNFGMAYGAGKKKVTQGLISNPDIIAEIGDKVNELVESGDLPPAHRTMMFRTLCEQRANEVYQEYHERIPGIKRVAREAGQVCRRRGYVFNTYGRRRHLPLKASHKAFNSIVQGCAMDIMKERMVAISPRYSERSRELGLRLAGNVHDEVFFMAPIECLNCQSVHKYITDTLETPNKLFRVPIRTGLGVSDRNWAEAAGEETRFADDGVTPVAGKLR